MMILFPFFSFKNVANFFSADFDEILTNIIYENKQLNAIISVKYIVYNRYRQADGRYPIKLRITYKGIPAIVSTNKFSSEEDLCSVKKGDTTLSRRVEDLIRMYEDAAANFEPLKRIYRIVLV